MKRDIDMSYNPQLGTWYNPLTWFGQESSPAPTSPSTSSSSSDPTKAGGDDFFAPGQEQVMQAQLEMEAYRKKMYWIVGGLSFALLVAILLRKKK